MSTEAQLKAISNSELASGNQIPALKHRTVNNAIIEEMYDAQSRGNVLAGVQGAVSIASGDQVLVIRSGQAYLLDADEFGFVDALADLTDVNIPTPANDQVLAYNTATSKWVAKDVNTLTSVVSISGTATTNALTKFTGTSSIGNSNISDDGSTIAITGNLVVNTNDLYINSSNSRVGIGTASPSTTLHVVGNILADFVSTTGNSYTKIFSMDQDIQTTDSVEFLTVTAGSFITTGGTSSQFVKGNGTLDSTDYQDTSEKGQANGYAPLDSGAKVAEAYLPDSILGQVSYQGTWDASTNTPTLANPPASTTKGEYYVTSVAGTQFSIDFQVGDWIISNGSSWEKVDNTDAVTSVFGRLGNIVANESDYASFYVDFDSDQSITGQKTFGSGDLRIVSGGSGNLPTIFINSSVGSSTESGFNSLGFNGSNDFYFTKGVGASFNGAIFSYDNDAIRTYTLQDASGTLAFTSDINDTLDSVTDRGATTTNAITVGSATINGNLAVDTDTLFVDSANNRVGIGTSSPDGIKLDVRGVIQSKGADSLIRIGELSSTSTYLQSISSDFTTSRDFVFFNTSERMRIDSSGNVGIGTSSPQRQLHVNGTAGTLRLQGTSVGGYVEFVSPTSTTFIGHPASISSGSTDDFAFYVAGSERMRIDSSGNVGIGTSTLNNISGSNPTLTLAGTGITGGLILQNSGTDTARIYETGNLLIYQGMSGIGHSFYVNAVTEAMRIDSSGNVGIGTDNPSQPLHIKKTGGSNYLVIEGANNASYDIGQAYTDGTNTVYIGMLRGSGGGTGAFNVFTGGAIRTTVDSSGNVGIGGSADQYSTSFSKFITLTDSTASGYTVIEAAGGSGGGGGIHLGNQTVRQAGIFSLDGSDLAFYTNSTNSGSGLTERMRIDSSGNVGIGTTSPAYPLHVEAASGGAQIYLSRVNAYARVYMGGTDSTASQLYIDAGGLGGVRLDYNTTSWTSASDIRLKNISSEISGTLNKLENIRAVNFSWKNDKENKNNYGVIAQEVEAEFPELVSESSIDNMKGVKYTEFVPILISAIKELKAEIETLKQQINGQ